MFVVRPLHDIIRASLISPYPLLAFKSCLCSIFLYVRTIINYQLPKALLHNSWPCNWNKMADTALGVTGVVLAAHIFR
ncbi:hypothetical protein V8F44DRAFT_618679 [Aspergillus fumigatus]